MRLHWFLKGISLCTLHSHPNFCQMHSAKNQGQKVSSFGSPAPLTYNSPHITLVIKVKV